MSVGTVCCLVFVVALKSHVEVSEGGVSRQRQGRAEADALHASVPLH